MNLHSEKELNKHWSPTQYRGVTDGTTTTTAHRSSRTGFPRSTRTEPPPRAATCTRTERDARPHAQRRPRRRGKLARVRPKLRVSRPPVVGWPGFSEFGAFHRSGRPGDVRATCRDASYAISRTCAWRSEICSRRNFPCCTHRNDT